MSRRYQQYTIILLFAFLFLPSIQVDTKAQTNTLSYYFQHPTNEAKPWTFWYWMYGAISKEGIAADMKAMKQAGLGGAYLMPIQSPERFPEFKHPIVQLTPEWWSMVDYSFKEADSLGLKLGMHVCDGFALAGGPWIKPEESMQMVVSSDTIISGGRITNLKLSQPETNEGFYRDIALLAYPIKEKIEKVQPTITYSSQINYDGKFYRAFAKDITDPKAEGAWIQYDFAKAFRCRSLEIEKVNNNYQAQRLKVMASDDGVHFRLVKQLVPARQGWQNYDFNDTHSIPSTTARYFRFYWNPAGSEPGAEDLNDAKWKPNLKIKDIIFHSDSKINAWEGKAGLVWRVALPTTEQEVPNADCVQLNQVIDLTASMQNGVLTATLPKGLWKIVRMGHTSTGHTNATGGGGKGLECDKFSATAVQKQIDNWFGAVYKHTNAAVARRVLTNMHVDSWECGSQNWSDNFLSQFQKRRGYDLKPYLLLYAGTPVESATKSEQVLRDIRTTIGELIVDVFYDVVAKAAKKYNCRLSAECVAPTMVSDGLLHYQKVDLPMGEFWYNSPTHDKFNDMLDAVSGAHIYGKNIVQSEGMTQLRGVWNEHPGTMKTLLDRNYALGANKEFFHVFVHNPYLDRKPGMTLDGIGFYFQRDQTWWKNGAKAIAEYATRCQTLLQYGKPVTDIAVFTGEEMPRRAVLPERLVSSLPGIFGEKRVESEKERLANVGQPLRTLDKVTFSKNMTTPQQWINSMNGYAYDSFNKDVLLKAKAENGQMVLPSGASYKVVVFPLTRPMNPIADCLSDAVKAKIEELRNAGVIIPSLPYEQADFSNVQVTRDAILPENIAFTHRSGDDAEIYFISNQQGVSADFKASLRDGEGQVQLWHATTGTTEVARNVLRDNGRIIVPLHLAQDESVFVVIVKNKSMYLPETPDPKMIVKPLPVKKWRIDFPKIDKRLTTSTLFDWTKNNDDHIKYYSGTVTYSTEFNAKKEEYSQYYLSFDAIYNVASIKVNGVNCGILWTYPYRIDITKELKKGRNKLEIEVSNTWANAIYGKEHGKAPFDGIWTNARYRMQDPHLLPAGIVGKVQMEKVK